jgi:uncharacterized membrane protein
MFSAFTDPLAEALTHLGDALGRGPRARWESLRRQLRDIERSLRRAADDARTQTEQALAALGVPTAPAAPVIDVGAAGGDRPPGPVHTMARQAVRSLAVVSATVLIGIALLALGIFAGAALLAFVVITRGLGLRIDVGAPRAAPAS